jgi:hypothetical protein
VDAAAVWVAQFEHVVGGLLQDPAGVIGGGIADGVLPHLLAHLVDAGMVQVHRVGGDGEKNVVFAHLKIFSHFDRGQHVGYTREAEQVQLTYQTLRHTLFHQHGLSIFLIEQPGNIDHGVVVDGHHQVGIAHVVDPRHVLVADAFDAVRPESVLKQGRALQGFARGDLAAGEDLLHIIAAGDGARRTGGRSDAAEHVAGAGEALEGLLHGVTGDLVMPQVVAELLELVEDHQVLPRGAQFLAHVEDLLDVGLAARRLDRLAGDLRQPLEALARHALRQDGDGFAAQQRGIIRAAPAVVAGGGPDRLLRRRVELTGHQPRDEAGEGRPHLVRAGREPLADDGDDARRDAGQRGGQLERVDLAEAAAAGLGLVVPVDAEQVARVDIPQPDLRQFFFDFRRNFGRVFHLCISRDNDIALAGAGNGALAPVGMDGQVDGGHGRLLNGNCRIGILYAQHVLSVSYLRWVDAIIFSPKLTTLSTIIKRTQSVCKLVLSFKFVEGKMIDTISTNQQGESLNAFRNSIDKLWDKLLVFCGVLFVLVPTSPLNMPFTYRDSGVFLYFGWRILNGDIPYRDLWDHKPPVIFYIDALGQLITNNSRWGVWLIEFIGLFIAAYIGFLLVKKLLGLYPAIFSLFLWLLTLVFVIEGGNLTTEYTLPLQFAAFWLIYDSNKPNFPNWRWFLVGLIGAIAFFTKQTAIGVWIAIILYLTLQRLKSGQVKRWSRELLFIAVGGLAFCFCVVVFFAFNGGLEQFWSAAFRFNFVYSSSATDLSDRLKPIIEGLGDLKGTGLFQLSMIGYIIGVFVVFRKNIIRDGLPVLAVGLIDLPIEWILISTSGRIESQYLMTLLPVLALFTGVTFWVLFSWLSSWGIISRTKLLFLISVMGIFVWGSFSSYKKQVVEYRNVNDIPLINYINSVTSPDDYVLLWGAEASINYFTQRESPTRFVYQVPLYKQGYTNEEMILEFLSDIVKNRPKIIIDTKHPSMPIYDFPIHSVKIDNQIAHIQSNYRTLGKVGVSTIYEYIESENSP